MGASVFTGRRSIGVFVTAALMWMVLDAAPTFGQFRSPDRALRQTALTGPSDSMLPRVCSPNSGVAYAAWGDLSEGFAFSADVWFAKTTNGGTTWTVPVRVDVGNAPGMGFVDPRWMKIACDASSNVVIAWRQETADEDDIYANVTRDGGTTWLARPLRLPRPVISAPRARMSRA